MYHSLLILQSGEKCGVNELSEVAAEEHPGVILLLDDVIAVVGCRPGRILRDEGDKYLHSAIGLQGSIVDGNRVVDGVGEAAGKLGLGLVVTDPEVIGALIVPVINVGVVCLYGCLC